MPHTDETFYKLTVSWAEDPKVVALARFGPVDAILARDLFSQMIGYSRRNLTDGHVPAEEVGRLMYPLPADDAERLVGELTDPGPYGALCTRHTPGNARGNGAGIGYRVLAYPKWNDTRADVEARTEHGRAAALRRWDPAQQAGHASGNPRASDEHRRAMPGYAEQEKEQEKTSRGRAGARTREGWTPHSAIDGPPPARKASGGPRTTHPSAAAAVADATRPGGPTDRVAEHAAEARRLLAERGIGGPPPELPGQLPLDPAPATAPADEYPF